MNNDDVVRFSDSCTFKIQDNGLAICGPDGCGIFLPDSAEAVELIDALLVPRPAAALSSEVAREVGADVSALMHILVDKAIVTAESDRPMTDIQLRSAVGEMLVQIDQYITDCIFSDTGNCRQIITIEILRMALTLARTRVRPQQAQEAKKTAIQRELMRNGHEAGPLRLILGAGRMRIPGWVSVDVAKEAQWQLDITKGWPLPDACVSAIYIGHVLEHFEVDVARRIIEQALRVLEPGGYFRVVVPDARAWLRAYVDNDHLFFQAVRETWPQWPRTDANLDTVMHYLGGGSAINRAFGHKCAFDFESLSAALSKAGFSHIQRSAFNATFPDGSASIDANAAIASMARNPDRFALYVTATK